MSRTISSLVSTFVEDLTEIVENNFRTRMLDNIRGAVKHVNKLKSNSARAARRKGPIQLCPVPGCKNRAAPVFGMVCSDHKGMPKSEIKAYRLARKAKKSGAPNAAKNIARAAKNVIKPSKPAKKPTTKNTAKPALKKPATAKKPTK